MEKKHQFAMLASIVHIVNGDWASLVQALTEMDVIKPGTNIRRVTMVNIYTYYFYFELLYKPLCSLANLALKHLLTIKVHLWKSTQLSSDMLVIIMKAKALKNS